jgi:hypothetical protein
VSRVLVALKNFYWRPLIFIKLLLRQRYKRKKEGRKKERKEGKEKLFFESPSFNSIHLESSMKSAIFSTKQPIKYQQTVILSSISSLQT